MIKIAVDSFDNRARCRLKIEWEASVICCGGIAALVENDGHRFAAKMTDLYQFCGVICAPDHHGRPKEREPVK